MTDIVKFDPKTVATIGNKVLGAILMHEEAKQEAQTALEKAEKREGFIDFELTKIALHLHNEDKIDLHDIYGDKDATTRLNRAMLVEMGVMQRSIDDANDRVVYSYTDKQIEAQYKVENPGKDAPEDRQAAFVAARSRRNALNIRFKRVFKAALSMADAKATPNDIQIVEKDGANVAQINKGPKAVMGKAKSVVVSERTATKEEGATFSPTLTGLGKVSDEKYAPKTTATSDEKGKTRADGENGTSEEDFLAMLNGTMNVVKGREGEFSKQEDQAMKNLLTLLQQSVKK